MLSLWLPYTQQRQVALETEKEPDWETCRKLYHKKQIAADVGAVIQEGKRNRGRALNKDLQLCWDCAVLRQL